MRHWKGWDAVNCPNESKLTQSWGEKWTRAKPTLTPPVTEKHVVVTILEPTQQSPPSPTIHYTFKEKLEGLRCCENLESIQKHTILVWKVGYCEPNLFPPTTQKPGCSDCYTCWIQISTLQNHSSYLQWDIERVEMLSIARISPNSLNLGEESGQGPSQLWPHPWLKNMWWWQF